MLLEFHVHKKKHIKDFQGHDNPYIYIHSSQHVKCTKKKMEFPMIFSTFQNMAAPIRVNNLTWKVIVI